MNKNLNQLINSIKLNISRKKLISKCAYSKLNVNILKILYHEGYIRGFKINEKEYSIYIYLKISNLKPIFKDIIFFPSNNKNNYMSYKKLISFFGLKNFGIVSTNIGLLTLEQCFFYKKGGQLIVLITH